QRPFRPDHHEIDALAPGEVDEPGAIVRSDRHALGLLRDAGIPRRAIELAAERRGRDRPAQRMLAPARPYHQDAHSIPARSVSSGPWRLFRSMSVTAPLQCGIEFGVGRQRQAEHLLEERADLARAGQPALLA